MQFAKSWSSNLANNANGDKGFQVTTINNSNHPSPFLRIQRTCASLLHPPKTEMEPWKWPLQKRNLQKRPFFGFHVCFPGVSHHISPCQNTDYREKTAHVERFWAAFLVSRMLQESWHCQLQRFKKKSNWWFQPRPIWKILAKMGIFPK